MCVLAVPVVADRCSGPKCEPVTYGRSLLQADAGTFEAASLKLDRQGADGDAGVGAKVDGSEQRSLTANLNLDVKIMAQEVTDMRKKMETIENTLGGASVKASLQQTASEPGEPLKTKVNALETDVAELLSRISVVETDVGAPNVNLLDITRDPVMGMANRVIALHVKVQDLKRRITKMEHAVLVELEPDASLLTKEVEILEGRVNNLKSSVQGPSLLELSLSDGGLKSQVSDLERRVGTLLSTTAALETEMGGPAKTAALLQQEKHVGLLKRTSTLKSKVANLKSRVFTLEHRVTGL